MISPERWTKYFAKVCFEQEITFICALYDAVVVNGLGICSHPFGNDWLVLGYFGGKVAFAYLHGYSSAHVVTSRTMCYPILLGYFSVMHSLAYNPTKTCALVLRWWAFFDFRTLWFSYFS